MDDPHTDTAQGTLAQWTCPICSRSRRIFSTSSRLSQTAFADLTAHLQGAAGHGHAPSGTLPDPFTHEPHLREYITITPPQQHVAMSAAPTTPAPADD